MTEQKARVFTRREMIKAAGLIGLGLVYSKPFVETVHAQSAFEGYDEGGGFGGLTPGYWKQPQHADDWSGYQLSANYGVVFGVTPSFGDKTLLQTLMQGGGDEAALGRHAVAGLLNAANPNINYAYTEAEVIAIVQKAYETGDFETAKNLLAEQNELEWDW
jgi:hypothetical protein